jgi:hypothetical protein
VERVVLLPSHQVSRCYGLTPLLVVFNMSNTVSKLKRIWTYIVSNVLRSFCVASSKRALNVTQGNKTL